MESPTENQIHQTIQSLKQRLNWSQMERPDNKPVKEGYSEAVNILVEDRRTYEGIGKLKTQQGRAIAVLAVDYLNGLCTQRSLEGVPLNGLPRTKGAELFIQYQLSGEIAGRGSNEAGYAQLLRTGQFVVGPDRLYTLLEEAEKTEQVLDLVYPIPVHVGPSEPYDVRLQPKPTT